ncbi:MAG: GNAT family N-acetyltransferase [Lachnospiraceae bacterium]|nr:GNAT family N-acetyltransferase [Lachnospiraceae bacterium]MCM1238893.1 GNAT family N-acetyltransferase [Lachnospiraceae bacterium]
MAANIKGEKTGRMELIKITPDFKEKEKLFALNDEAFPKEERIPSDRFFALIQELGCDAWAFYDGGFVGFAVLLPDADLQMAYLSYLAIDGVCRSKGYGGMALARLAEVYDGYQIALDMERMDESADNYDQRRRRLAFYERNGFRRASVGFRYFKMDLEIMCNGGCFRERDFRLLIGRIRLPGFDPVLYPISS